MIRFFLLIAFLALAGGDASAHEVRPALLDIRRTNESVCHITWKQPTAGEMAVRLVPRLSDGWLDAPAERDMLETGQRTRKWRRDNCSLTALERQVITIDGLDATITDVFVRVDFNDGRVFQQVVHPGDPPLHLVAPDNPRHPAQAYFLLGVSHILDGADHLAFVLGLVLLVGFRKRLFVAITAFTFAHSITLGATTIGLFNPWPALIEALVALSIVIIATEAWRSNQGGQSLTIRWPELAAFGFGLLHGFAFAGSLAEIGLPKEETLEALLLFNLGVEAGQILFVGVVLAMALAIRPFSRARKWIRALLPYAIGSFAGFLLIERVSAIFFFS